MSTITEETKAIEEENGAIGEENGAIGEVSRCRLWNIRPFVMYCVNGKPRSSLLIESTDSYDNIAG